MDQPGRPPAPGTRSGVLLAALTLLGLAGFAGCTARHFCMCGHMAHPPYSPWDYALDAGWVGHFAVAAGVAVWRSGAWGLAWAGPLGALAVSRFGFPDTMGMSLACVELPVSAALLVRSLGLLAIGLRDWSAR